jgi:hypothetical protein
MLHRMIMCFAGTCLMAALAPAQQLAVVNAGFEEGAGDKIRGWMLGESGNGSQVSSDQTVAHSGTGSLRIAHSRPASSAVESLPVSLEIGKLYRVSGWIRTDNAAADPGTRYPTAVAATLTMASFPFTNNATVVGGTNGWTKSEALFIATRSDDRVVLRLGYNGGATGTAWFDDVTVDKVDDITAYIPMETVRWFGPAFRYTDRGWTFVHIEGKPYERGYQYGALLAKEITAYMDKLAIRANADNPVAGWQGTRTLADALMLRRYDPEYLEEMKGIADGAASTGTMFRGRGIDLLDIVTVNSAVDLGQLGDGLAKSVHGLSGRSFRVEEDEISASERLHKCSSFLANGPATKDGKIVFGQLFMWNGYTGVHWDVICDVVPSRGHRLVYETFPGGIHSGADFYINGAGIMIGETTVAQTPFDPEGEPQSSRIRRAAQYAGSIDDVVDILTTGNNGLYTNDWLIGDTRANEIGILLLGTRKHKLWRSTKGDFPGGTTGFYWSVNNAKDPEVRKEYIPDPSNAPLDLVFSPWNRDLSFVDFYRKSKGSIDATGAVNVLATSPINRPHACDGKVTTSAMAEQMVFLANYGKVTMREKMPEKNSRLMPDLPGVLPHLSLGYTAFSPVFVTEKLKALRPRDDRGLAAGKVVDNFAAVKEEFSYDKRQLWFNTVFPASDGDNWFVSATAAYWNMLNALPAEPAAAMTAMRDGLTEMNCRMQYTIAREGSVVPLSAVRTYDRYGQYVLPRIRGTYALHQLRLLLGNGGFGALMNRVHERFREKPMSTPQFLAMVAEAGGEEARAWVAPWLERGDLPDPRIRVVVEPTGDSSRVRLTVSQEGKPYPFCTSVAIEAGGQREWKKAKIRFAMDTVTFMVKGTPGKVLVNAGNEIPVVRKEYAVFSNYFDDYTSSVIVYGSGRHIEANHSAALRFQTVLADQFTETFAPIRQDGEMSAEDLRSKDLIVLGGEADNSLVARIARNAGVETGKNWFRWQGKTYGEADDGLFVATANPFNPARMAYLFLGNSALEVYQMTKKPAGLPSWGVWKGDQTAERGYLPVEKFVFTTEGGEWRPLSKN